MKKLLLLAVFIPFLSLSGLTQSAAENNSIDSVIRVAVKSYLTNESYTRIPYKDFDDEINKKINDDIRSRWNSMIAWMLGIGGGILLFFFNYTKKDIQAKVSEGVNAEITKLTQISKSDLDAKINDIRGDFEKTMDLQIENSFLKNYSTYISKMEQMLDEINKKVSANNTIILDAKLEKTRKEVDAKNVTQKTFNDLLTMLSEAENLKNVDQIGQIITELSFASYYLKNEKQMEGIVNKYAGQWDVNIKENVYLNLASGFFYNYYNTGDVADRDKCLQYISLALKKLPDYGEALGLKLEMHMLDHQKTKDSNAKAEYVSDAMNTIAQVLQSAIASKELIRRFERVKTSKAEEQCIAQAYTLFPEKMKEIEDKAGSTA
jgi:hypothetical protein